MLTTIEIEIDGELITRIMRRYALPTRRAAVDFTLHRLDLEPMTRDEALEMRGTGWDGALAELREGSSLPRQSSWELDSA